MLTPRTLQRGFKVYFALGLVFVMLGLFQA